MRLHLYRLQSLRHPMLTKHLGPFDSNIKCLTSLIAGTSQSTTNHNAGSNINRDGLKIVVVDMYWSLL